MGNTEDLWLDDFSIIYYIIIGEQNGSVPPMTHSYRLHLTQSDLLSNALSPQNLFKHTSIHIYWPCIENVLLNIRQWGGNMQHMTKDIL